LTAVITGNGAVRSQSKIMAKKIHIHLVSHASGELIEMLARNSIAQLDGVEVEHRLWKMVRSVSQIPEILAAISETRGFVVHSISATDVRDALEAGCGALRVPCQFSLDPLLGRMAKHFDVPIHIRSSARDVLDEDYYRRIEAMKFALAHDDGVAADDLENADVVLVGVSRATKTPTCMYLASFGIKAANVPFVPGVPLPEGLLKLTQPLIVGLYVNPHRLALIRSARLKSLNVEVETDYIEEEALRREILEARRFFVRKEWPSIDVSTKSIEQTAALIIKRLKEFNAPKGEEPDDFV
jgi:[pyruvate, water dikinase]-phosphate phosphotransferase / [pyruvate, water dikinase] kinase